MNNWYNTFLEPTVVKNKTKNKVLKVLKTSKVYLITKIKFLKV